MKYNEETYKKEIEKIYGDKLKVVGHYKNLGSPILVEDKYGVMKGTARVILRYKPGIKAALNKTQYFMNQLKEVHPEIYKRLKPQSEYETMKKKMLFMTKFGLVSSSPDALIHGHCPNIRSAVDRKQYFENQLYDIYGNEYKFEISSTDRHKGRVTLICPKHEKVTVDSDSIFNGCGCPKCNSDMAFPDLFYLVELYNEEERFYKLGISHKLKNGKISRFHSYNTLGYNVKVYKLVQFKNTEDCKAFELEQKHLIREELYEPLSWDYESSTEAFSNQMYFNKIVENINNIKYDIVSTSVETQSYLLQSNN